MTTLSAPLAPHTPAFRSNRRPPRTRQVTLHRLPPDANIYDALSYVTETPLLLDLETELVRIDGSEALFLHGPAAPRVPDWCVDVTRTTGLQVRYETADAGALLFVAVDQRVYVIGYGVGHLWLADQAKDPRFGIRIALRGIDADQIKALVRRLPGQRGRTDSTLISGAATIWHLGLERQCDVVRRLGGNSLDLELACSRGGDRPVTLNGADGLTVRLGTAPKDFIKDIRLLAQVSARENPHPDLAFAENITPVTGDGLLDRLDEDLDDHLATASADQGVLSLSVPEVALEYLTQVRAYRFKIGSATRTVADLTLDDLLQRTRLQQPGERVSALRDGRVELHADSYVTSALLHRSAAIKWLEATGSIDSRRFFLLDGQWYEIAVPYLEDIRSYVTRLLTRTPPQSQLPAWQPGQAEKDYNLHVADVRPGYICLDRRGVTTRLQRPNGVEICDLLGPGNELIHVKKASASSPLSHLFAQGLVSFHTLYNAPEARRKFAELVARHGNGRVISENFVPSKIVFAILLKDGEEVTVDSLFPFSQVMLRQAAIYLEGKAELEVIGIPMAAY